MQGFANAAPRARLGGGMRLRTITTLTVAAALASPSAAAAHFLHTITPGESLYSIAAADGLSVASLAAANGLSADAALPVGGQIAIPAQATDPAAAPASAASAPTASPATDGDADVDDGGTGSSVSTATNSTTASYVVQPGDTLSAIAAREGMSVASLAAANGLDPAGPLVAGRVLVFGGAPSSSLATTAAAAPAVATPATAGGPYPTAARVTAGEVGQLAAQAGVPASLAQAIGWQESGFNNGVVSSTGAVGVMQVMPGTWNWIGRTFSAGSALNPASPTDNIRGGVLLLRTLLARTGGDPAMAAAAYYQGLGSVQRIGLLPSTRQYVRDVMALRARFGG